MSEEDKGRDGGWGGSTVEREREREREREKVKGRKKVAQKYKLKKEKEPELVKTDSKEEGRGERAMADGRKILVEINGL